MKTYICLCTLTGHHDTVVDVAFSPSGKLLASVSANHTIRLYDVATAELCYPLGSRSSRLYTVGFSPNVRRIASACGDQTVRLWDVRTGKCSQALKSCSKGIGSVRFFVSGKPLARRTFGGKERL